MMTTEESREFVSEYIKAISKDKSEAVIDKYVADAELKGHIIIFETGIPNYQLIAQDIIADGNKVTVRFLLEGEHRGDLFGVAPTGNKVKVDGIIIYEIENNKIVNHWMQADTVALMQQIGTTAVSAHS